jgi:hypothetical protein
MVVMSKPNDGYGFEREFCGCAYIDVDNRFRRHRIPSLKEGIKKVKELQSFLDWNPRRPKTPLADCLFRRVAYRLKNGETNLRLFIAIGTCLDLMGVDCFFEYERRVVTIDLTVRPYKPHPRANVVISRKDFVRNQHYHIADMIAKRLS